jgi:hypothetical protein
MADQTKSPTPTETPGDSWAASMRQALEQLRSEVDRRLAESHDQLRTLIADFEAGIPEPPPPPEPATVAVATDAASSETLVDEVRDAVAALFGADEQAELMARLVEQSSLFSSRCVLLLPEDAGLRCWASLGFGGAGSVLEGLRLERPEDAAWRSFEQGSRTLDAERCRLLTQTVSVDDPSEGCLIPLIVRGRVLAVLYADRLASERFSVPALQLLTQAASQALDLLALEEAGPSPTLALVSESELSTSATPADEPAVAPEPPVPTPSVEPEPSPTAEPTAPEETVAATAPEPPPVAPGTRVEPPEDLAAEPAAATEVTPPVVEPEPLAAAPPAPEPPPVPPAAEEPSHGFELVDASDAAAGGSSGEWELAPEPEPIEPAPPIDEAPSAATRHIPTLGTEEPEPPAPAQAPEELATQIIRPDDVARVTGQPPPPPEASSTDTVPKPPTEAAPPPPTAPVEPPEERPSAPAPAAPKPPASTASGGQVMPPDDLQGPGSAFTAGGPAPGGTEAEGPTHDEARRLARLLVSELKLYNEEQIEEGRREGNIYARLKEDIDRSRQMYEERVDAGVRSSTDYFREELVRSLAGGDPDVLGL